MMSESNKQQAVNKLTEIVANFTAMISTRMPDDVVDKLKQLKDAETSSMGKIIYHTMFGNDSNLLIVFYVQIMPDDFVMQLHRF